MGILRDSSIFVLGALAACSSNTAKAVDAPIVLIDAAPDAPKPIDAPPDAPPAVADLSCLTTPLPTTTSNATITLSGTAKAVSQTGQSNVMDATITAKNAANVTITTANNPQTTPTAGTFSFSITTNGAPVDGHLVASKTGLRDTLVYPPNPLVADQAGALTLMLDGGTYSQLSGLLGGAATEGATEGGLLVVVLDCMQNPVEGATVTVKQGSNPVGSIRYARPFMGLPAPNSTAASTDKSGTVWVFDINGKTGQELGAATTIVATQGATSFRPHVVGIYPTSLTTTIAVP